MVLFNGGTLYVDEGKPTPELVERTVENLRAVSPTLYFNVPRGFDMLLPFLERDAGAARGLLPRARRDLLRRRLAAEPALGAARGQVSRGRAASRC